MKRRQQKRKYDYFSFIIHLEYQVFPKEDVVFYYSLNVKRPDWEDTGSSTTQMYSKELYGHFSEHHILFVYLGHDGGKMYKTSE